MDFPRAGDRRRPRPHASKTFTAEVPGTLGRILSKAGYTAQIVVHRRDGTALTEHSIRALTALLTAHAQGEQRLALVANLPSAGEGLARQVETVRAKGAAKRRRNKALGAPPHPAAREARVRAKPPVRVRG